MAFLPRTPVHPMRTAGKVLLFTGVFLVGVAMLGAWKPYQQLRQATRVRVKVLKNEIGYKTANGFAYQLQFSWLSDIGEQRNQITTPVQAPNEEQALRKYRGRHIVAGQEYDFPVDPEDPTRIQPFLDYNWRTFGQFGISAIAGFAAFGIGMFLSKKGQALQKLPQI